METGSLIWVMASLMGFLVGSVPFGRIIGLLVARIDVSKRGSGNIGATNVAREVGLVWGILTLVLDASKGFVPLTVISSLFPGSHLGAALVGLCALLGHQYSIFMRFRGGKGVATGLGVFLAIAPLPCLGSLFIFLCVVYFTDVVSLGSMVSAGAMPVMLFFSGAPSAYTATSLVIAGCIVLKHRENIQRLLKGEERKWSKRHSIPGPQEADPALPRNRNE